MYKQLQDPATVTAVFDILKCRIRLKILEKHNCVDKMYICTIKILENNNNKKNLLETANTHSYVCGRDKF